MIKDENAIKALNKIMREHRMTGAEASAFVMLAKWLGDLEDRLKKKPGKESECPDAE